LKKKVLNLAVTVLAKQLQLFSTVVAIVVSVALSGTVSMSGSRRLFVH